MPPNVVGTANLMCTFGMAPSTLNVIRPTVMIEGKPAATITDMAPMVNIPPFGMCMSVANPTVAAATAAALGVLTPMPCMPATVSPWVPPHPTTLIGGLPAVTAGAMCNCAYGGVISVAFPGAVRTITG
jgi:uncharacterized Zn-binding protein involved in type VI secretion